MKTTGRILRAPLAAAALATALLLAGCSGGSAPADDAVAKLAGSDGTRVDVARLMADQPLPDVVVGHADAPVTIVEYASMTCDHCAAFHRDQLPAIKHDLLDTGKAKLILREFPFDPAATAAFMLARCAPGGKRTEMVDLLYQRSEDWAHSANAGVELAKLAKLAGMDDAAFKACLADTGLQAKVAATKERAEKDFGVKATPTFFIDGLKVEGGRSAGQMAATVAAIADAKKPAAKP